MHGKCRFWLHLTLILTLIISTGVDFRPVKAQGPTYLEVIFPNQTRESIDEYAPGQTFLVKINVVDATDLFAFDIKLWYKADCLTATAVTLGGFLQPNYIIIKPPEINDTVGYVWYGASQGIGETQGVDGSGTLAAITFKVDSDNASSIYLQDTEVSDSNGIKIAHDVYDGHFANSLVHDIAVSRVTPLSTKVTVGETVDVAVVARNHGTYSESFNVTVYANGTAIGTPNTHVSDLAPGDRTTLNFAWNTAGAALGKYFISANATTVPGETETSNNFYNMTYDFTRTPHVYLPITIAVRKPPIAVFDYLPKLPHVREAVIFNASESLPEGGTIETYAWDFGDTNRTSPSIYYKVHNNTFVAPGTFNVTLTVRDSEDLTNTTWKLVTVYPPDVAVISVTANPTEVTKPNPVSINVTVTNRGGLGTFGVTVCSDGKPIGQPRVVTSLREGTNKTLEFTWDTTYVPAITDGTVYELSANATVLLYETNIADNRFIFGNVTIFKPSGPSADFTYLPSKPSEGELMNFDASLSTRDPRTNAPIVSYAWDFGDGVKEIYVEGVNITQIATHQYAEAGPYTVKLNITDSDGLWDSAEATLTVYIGPPVASFTYSPVSPVIGDVVTFNSFLSDPNGGTMTGYIWNFGDNNITTLTEYIIAHLYAAPGTYTVTLNVTDNEGFWNTTSKVVTIGKKPSTMAITVAQSTTLGKSTTITGSISPTRTNAEVTISNRKTGTQAWSTIATVKTNQTGQYSCNWTPSAYGTFELKSSWTGDANTQQAESELKTMVVKAPPTASFTYTPSGPTAGDKVTFTSTSTDPDGSIQTWNWNFGDTMSDSGETVTHTYAKAGDFSVSLTVTDNDGLIHTFTKTVTVAAAKETTGIPLTLIAGAAAIVAVAIAVAAYYLMKKKS